MSSMGPRCALALRPARAAARCRRSSAGAPAWPPARARQADAEPRPRRRVSSIALDGDIPGQPGPPGQWLRSSL
eukprot:876034-Pyramimonas_sp.AAC.1